MHSIYKNLELLFIMRALKNLLAFKCCRRTWLTIQFSNWLLITKANWWTRKPKCIFWTHLIKFTMNYLLTKRKTKIKRMWMIKAWKLANLQSREVYHKYLRCFQWNEVLRILVKEKKVVPLHKTVMMSIITLCLKVSMLNVVMRKNLLWKKSSPMQTIKIINNSNPTIVQPSDWNIRQGLWNPIIIFQIKSKRPKCKIMTQKK
jgi:hypothetical protein